MADYKTMNTQKVWIYSSNYTTSGEFISYITGNTDDPYDPDTIPLYGSNRYTFQSYFNDPPTLKSAYTGSSTSSYDTYNIWYTNSMFRIDYPDLSYNQDDIKTDSLDPQKYQGSTSFSVSIGIPLGPITIGVSSSSDSGTTVYHKPYHHAEWDINNQELFPDSQSNSVGVMFDFDVVGNSGTYTPKFTCDHGFEVNDSSYYHPLDTVYTTTTDKAYQYPTITVA